MAMVVCSEADTHAGLLRRADRGRVVVVRRLDGILRHDGFDPWGVLHFRFGHHDPLGSRG